MDLKRRTLRTVRLAILALLSTSLPAQYFQTRSVHGTVTGPTGKAFSGAVVKIKDTRTLQVRSYITKRNGTYVFHGLSSAIDYELKAQRGSQRSDTKRLSQFDSRRNAEVDLRIHSTG